VIGLRPSGVPPQPVKSRPESLALIIGSEREFVHLLRSGRIRQDSSTGLQKS